MDYLKKYLKIYKIFIMFWTAFIGIGAVVGSCMFLFDPDNGVYMGDILPVMHDKMPLGDLLFSNFIFSGIALLICNGITNLISFYLILKNKKLGYQFGYIFGITLMLWICIQFYIFAPNVYLIDILFFIFGLLQFIFGYCAYVTYSQLQFQIQENTNALYQEVEANSPTKDVVVYFSRMGYNKKKAYEKAKELHCEVKEITTSEMTKKILGFWWCGRFGMHEWEMPINIDIDAQKYDNIYLFSPIWVFKMASPTRGFVNKYKDYFTTWHITFVHFMAHSFKKAGKEVKNIIGDKVVEITEISSHFGKYKNINK